VRRDLRAHRARAQHRGLLNPNHRGLSTSL
jgi:hypothetical protein